MRHVLLIPHAPYPLKHWIARGFCAIGVHADSWVLTDRPSILIDGS